MPDNTDPRLFSWVMISVFRNLFARPDLLLHGSGFYPYGLSLTFAEPLVTPALVAGPLFWWTGNPYLAYNVTLLLFWAASGWAMYAVTYWITRRHGAAAVAMLVFTLAPPRIEYAVEFQMEIMFGLPLSVYALVRYLETQRLRYLVAFLVGLLAPGHRRVVLRGHPRHGPRRARRSATRCAAGRAGGRRRCWRPAPAAWRSAWRWRPSPGRSS